MEHLQSKFLLLSLCLTLMSLPIEGEVRRGSSAGEAPSDTTLMREVSINGERQRISYRLDRQRIDATQLLTAQGGTALDVLRSVPGVTIDADGALSFRGSQEFLVYVDGKPSPLTGTEALQMIGAASIRDIEILTTPSAKYKTDGEVGIVNIVTRRSKMDGWDVLVNGTVSTWGRYFLAGLFASYQPTGYLEVGALYHLRGLSYAHHWQPRPGIRVHSFLGVLVA